MLYCCSFSSCYHSFVFSFNFFLFLFFLIYWDIEFLCSPNVIPCANRTTPNGFGIMLRCCRFFFGSTINGRWKASEQKFSPMEPLITPQPVIFLMLFYFGVFFFLWKISSVKPMKNKPQTMMKKWNLLLRSSSSMHVILQHKSGLFTWINLWSFWMSGLDHGGSGDGTFFRFLLFRALFFSFCLLCLLRF